MKVERGGVLVIREGRIEVTGFVFVSDGSGKDANEALAEWASDRIKRASWLSQMVGEENVDKPKL